MSGVVAIGIVSMAGCNQIVGFKDVTLQGDATSQQAGSDAANDSPMGHDAAHDGPPAQLFVFMTSAAFQGGFGSGTGARATADAKCQDKYNFSFPTLGCTAIHAVIQIDDNVDSLARMKINFPTIPLTIEVKRAVDNTPVSNKWDDFVDPNKQLLAPVSTDAGVQRFWSGRGDAGSNLSCAGWTSSASSQFGTAGNAAATLGWTADANVACDSVSQHFVCACW